VPEPIDPAAVLGAAPSMTGPELVASAQIPRPLADALWQALGFPHLGDDSRAFTTADAAALQAAAAMLAAGIVDERGLIRTARQLGRAMAGLAEDQVATTLEAVSRGVLDDVTSLLEPMEQLHRHIWRRHLFATLERVVARPDASWAPVAVGFTDLAGFTARSRELSAEALDDVLDGFEQDTQAAVVERGGRVVKTLGDEVMWVADDPTAAAAIALSIASDAVRTGVAYGPTLARGGDHFGPTVNVAARLTGLAHPGAVLIDVGMDRELIGDRRFRLRRLRPTSVRGYEHLRATVLRPATS
jgi:adenylate cyclase